MRQNKVRWAAERVESKKINKAAKTLRNERMTRALAIAALKGGADPALYFNHVNAHVRQMAAYKAKVYAGQEPNENNSEKAAKELFPNDIKKLSATFASLGSLFKMAEKHAEVVKREEEAAKKEAV